MAKNKKQKKEFISRWTEGQRCIIKDDTHKSKSFVPVQVDLGNEIEVVQVDGGSGIPSSDTKIYSK